MITERCKCDASFSVEHVNALSLWREWRELHKAICPHMYTGNASSERLPLLMRLPVRIRTALERHGFHTDAQITGATDEELLSIRNLGMKGLLAIRMESSDA